MAWPFPDQETIGSLRLRVLELPDRSGYRFHPVVHISRLKGVNDTSERPTTKLVADLDDTSRFDFDEDFLPEDSWVPDE